MSILIRNMEMPKSCPLCELYRNGNKIENTSCYCAILNTAVDPFKRGRPSDCPLIEVPTPHGRLIDADELLKPVGSYEPIHYSYVDGYVVPLRDISNAPTVIPADKDGE